LENIVDKGGQTHTFEKLSGYCVLALTPAMNSCQWGEIERIGNEVLKDLEPVNTPHLIVDLSELDYIGSAMVALVVRIWKLVKSKKARMVVVNKNPMVLEVFKIAKLNEVWEIVEFREDALDLLGISQAAKIERRESNALMFVSLLAALASASALAVDLTNPGVLVDPFRSILVFACSGIGVVMGLLFAVRSQGGRKAVGFLATLVSVGVLIAASVIVPVDPQKSDAQDTNANATPDESKKSP
jgi:anti-anti-sigma factor